MQLKLNLRWPSLSCTFPSDESSVSYNDIAFGHQQFESSSSPAETGYESSNFPALITRILNVNFISLLKAVLNLLTRRDLVAGGRSCGSLLIKFRLLCRGIRFMNLIIGSCSGVYVKLRYMNSLSVSDYSAEHEFIGTWLVFSCCVSPGCQC